MNGLPTSAERTDLVTLEIAARLGHTATDLEAPLIHFAFNTSEEK